MNNQWAPEQGIGVDIEGHGKKGERAPRRARTMSYTQTAWFNSARYVLQSMRARDAEVTTIVATGDLAQIAAKGRYLADEIAEGTCAYPNISAQLLENLRAAYAFYSTGTLPVEVGK